MAGIGGDAPGRRNGACRGQAGSRLAKWSKLSVETNGIANVARVAAKSDKNDAAVVKFEVTAESAGPRMMRFGYSDAVTFLVNGKPLFQGDAQFLSRDLQYLGTISFVVKESYCGWAAAAEFADATGLTGPGMGAPTFDQDDGRTQRDLGANAPP